MFKIQFNSQFLLKTKIVCAVAFEKHSVKNEVIFVGIYQHDDEII